MTGLTMGAGKQTLYAAGGVALLIIGLGYAIGSGVVMVGIHQKRERLRAEGTQVTARVSDWRYRNTARVSTVLLSYELDGYGYDKRVRCNGFVGCYEDPPATMSVWVDPGAPTEFVADNGMTDDSTSVFNGPLNIPGGLFVGALGGLLLFVAILDVRGQVSPRRPRRRGRAR